MRTTPRRTRNFILGLVAVASAGPGHAQSPADEAAPLVVAVRHLLTQLRKSDGVPEGILRLDSRILANQGPIAGTPPGRSQEFRLGADRSPAIREELLRQTGAQPGDFGNAIECVPDQKSRICRLRDAVAVFAVSNVVRNGDTAEVMVYAHWTATVLRGSPAAFGKFSISLAREGRGWRPVSIRTHYVT